MPFTVEKLFTTEIPAKKIRNRPKITLTPDYRNPKQRQPKNPKLGENSKPQQNQTCLETRDLGNLNLCRISDFLLRLLCLRVSPVRFPSPASQKSLKIPEWIAFSVPAHYQRRGYLANRFFLFVSTGMSVTFSGGNMSQ